jgi:hypothetical protein
MEYTRVFLVIESHSQESIFHYYLTNVHSLNTSFDVSVESRLEGGGGEWGETEIYKINHNYKPG